LVRSKEFSRYIALTKTGAFMFEVPYFARLQRGRDGRSADLASNRTSYSLGLKE
jgi:hypothetical protein